MEQGLAYSLAGSNTYGSGVGQNTGHYYAGTIDNPNPNNKRKNAVKQCKTKKK